MQKEKYKQIVMEEANKVHSAPDFLMDLEPSKWEGYRAFLVGWIKEVDKATEVYNLENGKKGA